MRKYLLAIAIITFLGCSFAYAGGSGDSVLPLRETTEFIGVGGGFEYNYVGNRLFDLNDKLFNNDVKSLKVKNNSQIYGKFPIGITKNTNLTAEVGGVNYDVKFINKNDVDAEIDLKLTNGLYVGLGLNGAYPLEVFNIKNLYWGYTIQGAWYQNDVKSITRNGVDATDVDGTLYNFDGQNSLYLAYKWDWEGFHTSLIPYIGAFQTWMILGTAKGLTYKTSALKNTLEQDICAAYDFYSFGMVLGMDIDIAKYVSVNIEGRFIGENAVTTGVIVKF